jgi:hypothetical protein
MNIDDLTIRQARELAALFGGSSQPTSHSLNRMIGQKVIIRTYSAGNWFGVLAEKAGSEVILNNARRMWYWVAAESISLSACALHGINQARSKVVSPVDSVWLEAIEIIPCTAEAILTIEGANHVLAQ